MTVNAFGQTPSEEAAELATQYASRGVKAVVICDTDGCLTDNTVRVDTNGLESLTFTKRDFWLLPEARAAGIEVVMVTDDPNAGPARERARKLGVEFFPCAAPTDDAAEVSHTKAGVVKRYKAEGRRVVYIGDSPADLEAMREADEAWCPQDGCLPKGWFPTWHGTYQVIYSHIPKSVPAEGQRVINVTAALGGHGVLHEVLGYLLRCIEEAAAAIEDHDDNAGAVRDVGE